MTDELESSYSKTNVSTDDKDGHQISLQNLIDEIKFNPTSFSPVENSTEFTQEILNFEKFLIDVSKYNCCAMIPDDTATP